MTQSCTRDYRNALRTQAYPILPLVLLLGILTGCQRRSDDVRILLAEAVGPATALVYVAEEQGLFKDEGVDVVRSEFASGREALDAVMAGRADVATVAETPIVYGRLAGQTPSIFALIAKSPHSLVARRDHGVGDVVSLRGKRVGTTLGSAAEFFLRRLIDKHELDWTDIDVVNLRPPDLIPSIARGDISAYTSWQPFVARGVEELGSDAYVLQSTNLYTQYFVLAARAEYVRDHADAVDRVVRAMIRAEDYARANPGATQKIVSDRTGLTVAEVRAIWADHTFVVEVDDELVQTLVAEAAWLDTVTSRSGDTILDGRWIDVRPLRRVSDARVKLVVPETR